MAVTLTEPAAHRVRDFLSKSDASVGLRFGVRPSGCSGFAYVVDLATDVDGDDKDENEDNDVGHLGIMMFMMNDDDGMMTTNMMTRMTIMTIMTIKNERGDGR